MAILLQFLHNLFLAFADAFAPAQQLYLKSLHPDLDFYHNSAVLEAFKRANKVEAFTDKVLNAVKRGNTDQLNQAIITKVLPIQTTRKTVLGFETAGKAGETKSICISPQMLFRGKKLIATDDSENPGKATHIVRLLIGQRNDWFHYEDGRPMTISSAEFAYNKINNELLLDTCRAGYVISIDVQFNKDCIWNAALFGDACY